MKRLLLVFLFIPCLSFGVLGLKVGDSAPRLKLKDIDGLQVSFLNQSKAIIVVFYRGSWCPYCIRQLKGIQEEIISKTKNKAEVIAISADKLSVAKKMRDKFSFKLRIISDPKVVSLNAFKIVNKLSDSLVKTYKSSYKIDIEGDSGETHHMIAHPAVFIIKNNKITFADIHTDYTVRTKNSDILKAL